MPLLSRMIPLRRSTFALAIAMLAVQVFGTLSLPLEARAAWPPDPMTNVPLCTTAFSSQIGATVTDQRGGAIAVWYEDRAGDFDVFARRVDASGTPRWTANGIRPAT